MDKGGETTNATMQTPTMDTPSIHASTKCVGAVLMFEYRNAVEYVMDLISTQD